tara:strand:- start:2078 stop:2416 length:339 start_codon:yes stop_codon:yes gene_type:complete
MTKDELEKRMYDSFIEKSIKKDILSVTTKPYDFVRNIPKELANDIRSIKRGELPKNPDLETVNRIKYICELSLSKMSDRRKKIDSDPNSYVKDHFTEYQDALKWVESHLKDS